MALEREPDCHLSKRNADHFKMQPRRSKDLRIRPPIALGRHGTSLAQCGLKSTALHDLFANTAGEKEWQS
jgi:hypothetical protein